MQYVQPDTPSWKTPMFLTFGLWALSAILLFCNWFKLDLYFAKLEFSVFSLNKATSQLIGDSVYDNSSSLETLNIFVIVSSVLFLLFLVSTVALFFVQKKGMFTTGITLSALLIIFTVIVMIAYFSATGSEDLAGLISGAALEMTIAPYLLIVASILSLVATFIAHNKYCQAVPKNKRTKKNPKANLNILRQKTSGLLTKAKPYATKFFKSKYFICSLFAIGMVLVIVAVVLIISSASSPGKSQSYKAYSFSYNDVDYTDSYDSSWGIDYDTYESIIPVIDDFVETNRANDFKGIASLYNEEMLNLLNYTNSTKRSQFYNWAELLKSISTEGMVEYPELGVSATSWHIRSAEYTFFDPLIIFCGESGLKITNAVTVGITSEVSFGEYPPVYSSLQLVEIDSKWYIVNLIDWVSSPINYFDPDEDVVAYYENSFWNNLNSDSSVITSVSDINALSEEWTDEWEGDEYLTGEDIYYNDIEFYDSYDSSWGIDYDTYQELVSIAGNYVLAVKNNDISSLSRLFCDELLQYSIQQDPDEFDYDNWEDILYNLDDGCWYVNYENLDYLGIDISEWSISYAETSFYSEDDRNYIYDQTGIDLRGSAAIYIDLCISGIYHDEAMYIELAKIGSEWYVAE